MIQRLVVLEVKMEVEERGKHEREKRDRAFEKKKMQKTSEALYDFLFYVLLGDFGIQHIDTNTNQIITRNKISPNCIFFFEITFPSMTDVCNVLSDGRIPNLSPI